MSRHISARRVRLLAGILTLGGLSVLLTPGISPAAVSLAQAPAAGPPVLVPTAAYVPIGATIVVNATGCSGSNHAEVSYTLHAGLPGENVFHTDNPITVNSDGTFQSTAFLDPQGGLTNGDVLSIVGVCGFFFDELPQSAPVTVIVGPVPEVPTTAPPTTIAPTTTTTAPAVAAQPVTARPAFTG
jgi:hypothetical protein